LKPNVIGIVGGIIAFISLVLPWWTIAMSIGAGMVFSETYSIYPYQVTASADGVSMAVTVDIWYGGAALALVILGGFLGVMGSLVRTTRLILVVGGIFALLSVIVFAAGLQSELSNSTFMSGWPSIALFSSGTMAVGYLGYSYTAYLSFGFWLALASAIIMLIASSRKPKTSPPPPPTPDLEKAMSEKEAGTNCLRNKEPV
jgi:hypothetical protein